MFRLGYRLDGGRFELNSFGLGVGRSWKLIAFRSIFLYDTALQQTLERNLEVEPDFDLL